MAKATESPSLSVTADQHDFLPNHMHMTNHREESGLESDPCEVMCRRSEEASGEPGYKWGFK